jgi:hypothetical protein
MGVARRRWSPDEKATVLRLAAEGYTQKQIAEKLRPGVKSAWRSVGVIVREERERQIRDVPVTNHAPGVSSTPVLPSSKLASSNVTLPDGMTDSLTAREFMTLMDDDQKAIFVATYEDLRGDADEEALTSAENEMLIRASYSHIKYLRAQSMLHRAETYLMDDLDGKLSDSDDDKAKRRFAGGREVFKKEVEQWQKEYMDYLNDLKLTRRQRLDKIKDTRNTFLDLQQELTDEIRRESIVEEIRKINSATEQELYRMARGEIGPDGNKHPWLIGAFDEYVEPIKEKDNEGN